MPQSSSVAELAKALSQAQSEMKPAKKDSENPFFKSHYADLASVWDAIREPFTKHGLSVVQLPSSGHYGVGVTTLLLHVSGEWVSGDLVMKPIKDEPQSIGSCLTYARRYALSAIAGVATEDDDGYAATQPKPQPVPHVKETPAVRPVTPPAAAAPAPPVQNGDPTAFVWRMGKWKSAHIQDIDTHYLKWFLQEGKEPAHREAAQRELDRRTEQASMVMEEGLIEELP